MTIARDRIRTHDDGNEERWLHVLPVGTRVRSKKHPELTGYVKRHEYHESGRISPIPYCIGWDDSAATYIKLGMGFVYATDGSIEAIDEVPA